MNIKIVIGAIILIAGLGASNWITFQAYQGKSAEVKVAQGNEKAYNDSLVITKDNLGRETAQKYILQSSIKNIVLGNASEVNDLKAILKDQDLKLKNLLSYSNIETKIDTFLKVQLTVKDSTYHFVVNPEFLADVKVDATGATFHPTLTNTQTLAFAEKRETILPAKKFFLARWFQRRHTVIKVVVRNSNLAIKTKSLNATFIIKK